ncbi:MAG: universal stress protein [bacterium]|nr:universal stress protein [bacterium]
MASRLFRRILVPHDFSDAATRALREAAQLAADHGGRLTVLHVVVPFYVPTDLPLGLAADSMPAPATFVPELRKRLESAVAKVIGTDGPPATVRVEIGNAAERILDAARRADCVVMATHGRTGLAHLFMGSVAEKVIRHAPAPVLVLRVPPSKKKR